LPTITKTIGAAGDYATPAAAATAFVAGTVAGASAADDIVFNIIDNAAFDSTFLITANPTGYASYKLTVDASVRHDGTEGSGARLAISTTVTSALSDTVTALVGTIEWLEVTVSGSGKITTGWLLTAGNGIDTSLKTMRNCILHDNGTPTQNRVVGIGNHSVAESALQCSYHIHNTRIYRWKTATAGGAAAVGIGAAHNNLIGLCVNCTIDDIDIAAGGTGTVRGIRSTNAANKTVKNCAVTKIGTNTSGTKTCFSGNGASTVGNNNASDDATAFGTSSLTSIVRGNQYVDADAGDFTLASGSDLFEAGADLVTTPTGVNFDITGRDRDALADTWSIGASQLETGGGVSNAIALTAPEAYRVHQRSSGVATVTVEGTYTGTPTTIEAQIDAGAWAELDATPGGGTFEGTLSVAEGTRSITVRFANDTGVTATVSNVLVGDVFVVAGQSNAEGRATNDQTYTHASQKAGMFKEGAGSWVQLADPSDTDSTDGSCWPLLATQFLADQVVPIGFITTAEGGTKLYNGDWDPQTPGSKLTNCVTTVNNSGVNAVKAVLWFQGETDAIDGVTESQYKADLDALAVYFAANLPGAPGLLCGQIGKNPGASASGNDAIRAAQASAWGDASGVEIGPVTYDLTAAAGHFATDADIAALAKRWWAALDEVFYGGTQGRGPRFVSASLNEDRDQTTVAFDLDLTTGLTFSTAPWDAKDDGVTAAVSAVTYHPTDTKKLIVSHAVISGTPTLSLGSGDTGAGAVVPTGPNVTMPAGGTINQPAEPFIDQTVSTTASGGSGSIFSTPIIRGSF
jgi:hypothetical protein